MSHLEGALSSMGDLGPLPINPDHPGFSSDDGRLAELLRDRLDHALVDAVAALLFEADLTGVADGDNTEEHLVEAAMIVVGLPGRRTWATLLS